MTVSILSSYLGMLPWCEQIQVHLGNTTYGPAKATTKKEAEQLCAKIALDQFKFNWRLIIDSNKELFDCAKDGYIEVTDWDYL